MPFTFQKSHQLPPEEPDAKVEFGDGRLTLVIIPQGQPYFRRHEAASPLHWGATKFKLVAYFYWKEEEGLFIYLPGALDIPQFKERSVALVQGCT